VPANCEIQPVIRSLSAGDVQLADIHYQICEACGENAMSDGMVREWVRKFKEDCDNMHDEPWSGQPSVVTGDHVLRGGDAETGAPL
jgi:hypothetical protein